MSSYNKVILLGRITRDIELKFSAGNMAIANIGLALNHKFKKKDGSMVEETTFVDCEAFGKTAETMNQYLAKGMPVFIEGRLKLDQWQAQDGSNRSKLKVVIDSFTFVGGREQQREPQPAGSSAEDDIPF